MTVWLEPSVKGGGVGEWAWLWGQSLCWLLTVSVSWFWFRTAHQLSCIQCAFFVLGLWSHGDAWEIHPSSFLCAVLGSFSLLINSPFLKHTSAYFSILEWHVSVVSSMGLFGIALQRAFPYPHFSEHVRMLLIDQDPGESDSSRLQKMTASTYSPHLQHCVRVRTPSYSLPILLFTCLGVWDEVASVLASWSWDYRCVHRSHPVSSLLILAVLWGACMLHCFETAADFCTVLIFRKF